MNEVAKVMTRGVRTMGPTDTLVQAAQAMDELNIGALPICEDGRLVGMLTDRDIVLRGVAQDCTPQETRIGDVMSGHVRYCYEDEQVEDVSQRMRQAQVRRLPVLDREETLVGMLSLGDVAVRAGREDAAAVLAHISEPARPDRSSQSQASAEAGGGEQPAR